MNTQNLFEQYGKAIFLSLCLAFLTWIGTETPIERGNYIIAILIVIVSLSLIYGFLAEARRKASDQVQEHIKYWKTRHAMGISIFFILLGWSPMMKAIENDTMASIVLIAVGWLGFSYLLFKSIWNMSKHHNTEGEPG
ncbi:MAG TPA: hypothetical protein VI603_07735 [Saprospiraceae bacterium]|nr:hypothetical protein [Saprospiraceae bacterium]